MLNYDEVYDELEKTQGLLTKMIRQLNEKGDITPPELGNLEKAVCVMEKIIKLDSMIDEAWNDGEEDGYSEYYDGMRRGSYTRGRSPRTGRYVSRENTPHGSMRGMSRHSLNDRMVAHLESMMDDAGSDFERKKIGEWIDKIRTSPET